jgi:hypothetical protein
MRHFKLISMKTCIPLPNVLSSAFHFMKHKSGLLLMLMICCFQFSELKSQRCDLCKIPSFPSLTVYQVFQTGHGMGFGVEAGTWNKDASRFSYFIGTSMVWANYNNADNKLSNAQKQAFLGFYLKGQYQLSKHLYVVAAPGILNLSIFEFQSGLRYVVPVTRVIGIGIEPSYAFNQKQFVLNANLHFALK